METMQFPPYSPEAERAVIGACLLNDKALKEAVLVLMPKDFFDADNREVFQAIQTLAMDNKGVDSVTVAHYLSQALDQPELAGYVDAVGSAGNQKTYINIILEKSLRRKLMESTTRLYQLSGDENTDISRAIEEARDIFLGCTVADRIAVTEPSIFRRAREERMKRWGQLPLAGLGIPDIDAFIGGGLLPGEIMIIVGADGSMKTSLALKMAENYITKIGWKVLYVSMDMPAEVVDLRRLLPLMDMGESAATSEQAANSLIYQQAVETREEIDKGKFRILEGDRTLVDIRRAIELESPGLVIVDYLTAIEDGKSELEKSRMATRAFKRWATDYQVVIVALNQMSQENKVHQKKGGIGVGAGLGGQDPNRRATVVIELMKDISGEAFPNLEAKLIAYICKNRKGPEPLAFKVHFDGPTMQILNTATKVTFKNKPKPIFSDGGFFGQ